MTTLFSHLMAGTKATMPRAKPPKAPKQRKSIQQRFDEFHERHPEIYRQFQEFSRQLIAAGVTRTSADLILHRIRWETMVNKSRDGGFKINNIFSSRYARKLATEDPLFADFFEFRRIKP